ncbi:hypothetical protein N7457_005619 [Penicillium paradoxum]|uniref:uncharacterized protein n=1 Tax=Penicillium paradoxum TaxID=176176 RepID=UPI0025465B75|nr:uncharacterized protein N7457_005619 [Penicillium paradoxum]KAJ5780459.1 hypothetical protein N7457_005619 [Penicillium paradoxum]
MNLPIRTSSTVANLSPEYPHASEGFGIPQNMYHHPSYPITGAGMPGFGAQTPQSLNNETTPFFDEPSTGDQYIGVARVVESHGFLNGIDHKVQRSLVSQDDTKLLCSVGLDKFIGPLPAKSRVKQQKTMTPCRPTPEPCADLVLQNKASSTIPIPIPQGSPCQFPCARSRLQLSTNEHLELSFKMSPARGSSHFLRTRVQVVVKLFRLHSSVAKQSTKDRQTDKQKACRTTSAVDLEEHAESDIESECALSPPSSSNSELTPTHFWEVQDWSFSIGVPTLIKLLQWATGFDADTCKDLMILDPDNMLKLICEYCMHNFRRPLSLMGRSGLNPFWIL